MSHYYGPGCAWPGLQRALQVPTLSLWTVDRNVRAAGSSLTRRRSQSATSLTNVDTSPRRSSFAASFAQSSSATSLPSLASSPPSPTTSKHERQSSLGHGKPPSRALEPQQVVDLAKGLMTPVCATDVPATGPKRARRKSVSGYDISHPTPETEALALEPVEYRELPPGALLPFIDRPSEVEELIFTRNVPLADSLKSTLPSGELRAGWAEIDATLFNFAELRSLMTEVDRPQCADYEWCALVRAAVRTHSAALWETLGECLGCDAELMVAGDDPLLSDFDSSAESTPSRVFIRGLPSVGPEERKEVEAAERALALEFGDADDVTAAWSMDTIGEDEAGTPTAEDPQPKRRSVVGIQILTSDLSDSPASSPLSPSSPAFTPSPLPASPASLRTGKSPHSPHMRQGDLYERTPGNPLFPSSFSTLSVQPTLGPGKMRVPSGGYMPDTRRRSQDWNAIRARLSGTGLSESAITFVSDSSLEV